ncbi:unnamed protein product, partial [Discosporangium mesarthrocarpum]
MLAGPAAAPTLKDIAAVISSADPPRGREFERRLVEGRPPAEEEAGGKGGGVALRGALLRQRAAYRALALWQCLRERPGTDNRKGGESSEDKGEMGHRRSSRSAKDDLGLGLGMGAEVGMGLGMGMSRKSPPTMTHWQALVAYVTWLVEVGTCAIQGKRCVNMNATSTPYIPPLNLIEGVPTASANLKSDGLHNLGSQPTTMSKLAPMITGLGLEEGGPGAGDAVSGRGGLERAQAPGCGTGADGDTASGNVTVGAEVARSPMFAAFERGLNEAVRVCRFLEASAIDGLSTIKGTVALEANWHKFLMLRGVLRRQCGGNGGNSDGMDSDGGEGGGRGIATSGASDSHLRFEDGVVRIPRVEEIREMALEAPAGAELCGVCLQPLEALGLGQGLPILEYCGVHYISGAANLWVN